MSPERPIPKTKSNPTELTTKPIWRRDGFIESKFVEPGKSGDKVLKLMREMESPIAAGLRDGGKNRKDL